MATKTSRGCAVGPTGAAIFVLVAVLATPSRAQNATIDTLSGKVFDAKMAQQTFAAGLPHCAELDGTNFYFQQRDRVLNLEDYHRSLESLVIQRVFNPETKRPWNQEDADVRWAQVQQQAVKNKADCALVASLPEMQRQLDDLRRQAATSPGNPAAKQ
jgi:hypothetical protein